MAAIDKIIPKRLNYDGDERTVSNGDMVDAQNITLSIDGDGSFGVMKNIKGTIPGTPATPEDAVVNAELNVAVGQVSDDQRGFIYYAVYSNGGNHTIYQYNTSDDTYRVVLKDSRLGFQKESFVKMDVVNGQFQQDETTQTILYFTDNINPPRKINVDRAFSGDYNGLSQEEFDYSLNSIKAAPVLAPSFSFSDDSSIPFNSFKTSAFQFATQLIYKDGEVSAISPYSGIAVSSIAAHQGVSEVGFGVATFADNVCLISLNLDQSILSSGDAKLVRLMARNTNDGNFFIVDEFNPTESVNKNVFGVSGVNVYEPANGIYRFYNDVNGPFVSTVEVDKMYDNVPQQAEGQTISGNRLMYSNYTEGYANVNVSASIDAVYSSSNSSRAVFSSAQSEQSFTDVFTDTTVTRVETPGVSEGSSEYEISINFQELLPEFNWSDPENQLVQSGVQFQFDVEFRPNISSVTAATGNLVEFTALASNGLSSLNVGALDMSTNSIPLGDTVYSVTEPTITSEGTSFEFNSNEINASTVNGFPKEAGKFSGLIVNDTDRNLLEYLDFLVERIQILKCRTQYFVGGEEPIVISGTYSDGSSPSDNLPKIVPDSLTTALIPLDGDPIPRRRSTVTVEFGFIDFGGFEVSPGVGSYEFTFKPVVVDVDIKDIAITRSDIPSTFHPQRMQHRTYFTVLEGPFGPLVTNGEFGVDTPFIVPLEGSDSVLIPTPDVETPGISNFIFAFGGLSSVWLSDTIVSCFLNGFTPGFKSGSQHRFGVVYYDKYNRSGFVNDIGTGYAGWYNDPDRIQDDGDVVAGPAAFRFSFDSAPPPWAEAYQIVYPGSSTVSDFVQYTTGSAYPALKGDIETGSVRELDTTSKRIYVSLETLQKYKAEKPTARDYSFTKGDRLRVVSFRGDTENFTIEPDLLGVKYPSATDGSVVEFEVVGVENLVANEQNPIAVKRNASGDIVAMTNISDDIDDQYTGLFVVLEHSSVSSGATGIDGQILKYRGFDWFSVVRDEGYTTLDPTTGDYAYLYSDGSAPTAFVKHWEAQTVVEIYSPKAANETPVYYEIGETRPIVPPFILGAEGEPTAQNQHGPSFLVTAGDVSYRPVSCKGPFYEDHDDDGDFEFNFNDPDGWGYETKMLESLRPIETSSDKSWSKGRAHVKFENAATVRRFNGITYSDAYNEDVAILTLSSFNASLANFYSLSSKYGAARYISDYGDIGSLIAVQENKFSQTSVDKSIITDAAGQNNVALSTNVLGTTKYYNGDYGCANHPESVLVQDNDVYFFDRSRQKVLRFAGGQLFPISDKGAASLFEKETDKFNRSFSMDQGKIVSGYDPSDDQYFITFRPTSLALNYTLNENEPGLEDVSEATNNSYSFAVWFRMNDAMLTAQESVFTILSDYRYLDDPAPTIGIDTLFSTNLEVSLGDGDPQLVFTHRLGVDIPTGITNNTTFVLTGDITAPDEWQHCCIVVDTSDQLIKMYLNGELVDSVSNDTTGFFPVEENNYNGVGGKTSPDGTFLPYLDFDQTELRVGRRVGYSNLYPFIGEIDDISFFNEALTDLEVSTISGGGVYPDSVQAFYPFIQGTVSDVISGFGGEAVGSPELGSDRNGFAGGSFFFSGDEGQYVSLPPFRQIIPREEQEVEIIEVEPDTIPPPTFSDNQDNPYAGLTVSYDVSQSNGIWTSRHTFFPNLYSNQNNRMFSAINVVNTFVDSTALMFHKHADNFLKNNRSTFYAQPTAESFARVVSNTNPSAVKVYDAISYEGDTAGFNVRIESSDGARTNVMNHFDKRENSYYINAGRDTTTNSTSQITGIGNCIGIDTTGLTGTMQMDSNLIGIPVMVGSVIKRYNADTGSLENIGPFPDQEVTVLDVYEDGVIQTSAVDASSAIGSPVVLITNSEIDGDSIRGHYALIKLSNTSNIKYEVYCVNAHVTLSNLNHSR